MSIETIDSETIITRPSQPSGKEYPNHEMLDEVFAGMLEVLKRHDGMRLDISLDEMVRHTSNVSREALTYYYKSPESILDEAAHILAHQVKLLATDATDFQVQSLLMMLMEGFHRQRTVIHIFLLLGDHQIWRDVMKPLFPYLLKDWTELDASTVDYIYGVFCDQLASILTLWTNVDFAENLLPSCVMLLQGWLELDSMFADAHGALLAKWK